MSNSSNSDIGLGNLYRRRKAQSRSISAENPTGEKGKGAMAVPDLSNPAVTLGWPARELGKGWKVRPAIAIEAGETVTLMDHDGPGVIRHIWVTFGVQWCRDLVLRIYWDGQEHPSVQCPIGDFFCNAWTHRSNVLALPINVNPSGGMNSYFQMPFRKHVRITITNEAPKKIDAFFYTINFTLEEVPQDALYFHAYWRRSNPLPYKEEYLLVDGIKGAGHFVGTFMAWQQNSAGWWGEGEIKMYIDGDSEHPTICGTGTEDYFGGAWCFLSKAPSLQVLTTTYPRPYDQCVTDNYSAPFMGFQQVTGTSLFAGARMTMYRFHVHDPIHFDADLKVTIQALGWRGEMRYLPLQDDLASVSYWYQTLPHAPLPPLQPRDVREVI